LTLLARVGIAEVGSTYQSSHSGEGLLSQSSARSAICRQTPTVRATRSRRHFRSRSSRPS